MVDSEIVRACEAIASGIGGAVVAKPLLERFLGPSFDYVGRAMADMLERYGNRNVADIFIRAAQLSDDTQAYIHPRVCRTVIEEGSFCDDELTKAYLAGLLASSRSPDGTDDGGLRFLYVVRALSRLELSLHHFFYSSLRQAFPADAEIDLSAPRDVELCEIGFPTSFLERTFTPSARWNLDDAVRGLSVAGLIDPQYALRAGVTPYHDDMNVPPDTAAAETMYGVTLRPSAFGARLFLSVHGHPTTPLSRFFDSGVDLKGVEPLPFPEPAQRTGVLKRRQQIAGSIDAGMWPESAKEIFVRANRVAFHPELYDLEEASLEVIRNAFEKSCILLG